LQILNIQIFNLFILCHCIRSQLVRPAYCGISPLALFRILRAAGLADQMWPVARPDWTAVHLWHAVQQVPQDVWSKANVVTVLIGGNDLRRRYYAVFGHPSPHTVVDRAVDGCAWALGRVCSLLAEQGILHVSLGTLYNPVPHSALSVRAFARLNEVVTEIARKHGFTVADIADRFAGRESAFVHRYRTGRIEDLSLPFGRPVHPNDAGHAAISEAFWTAISGRHETVSSALSRPHPRL
jgi:lysophospholipase L1-like esterase